MVATANLGGELILTETAIGLGLEILNMNLNSSLDFFNRIKEPKVALLLFSSGKIVCAGARNTKDISKAAEKLFEELSSLGLLH